MELGISVLSFKIKSNTFDLYLNKCESKHKMTLRKVLAAVTTMSGAGLACHVYTSIPTTQGESIRDRLSQTCQQIRDYTNKCPYTIHTKPPKTEADINKPHGNTT